MLWFFDFSYVGICVPDAENVTVYYELSMDFKRGAPIEGKFLQIGQTCYFWPELISKLRWSYRVVKIPKDAFFNVDWGKNRKFNFPALPTPFWAKFQKQRFEKPRISRFGQYVSQSKLSPKWSKSSKFCFFVKFK